MKATGWKQIGGIEAVKRTLDYARACYLRAGHAFVGESAQAEIQAAQGYLREARTALDSLINKRKAER